MPTIEELTKRIEADPDDARAYLRRGVVYSVKRDFAGAIADFTKTIELDPESKYSALAYRKRGDAYFQLDDAGKAANDYKKAIQLDPKHAGRYSRIQPFAEYTKAIELDPANANAYFERAAAYSDIGDFDSSAADFTKAVELDPANAQAYYGRGSAYAANGDFDSAAADFTKTIELKPDDAQAYYRRGKARAAKGDDDSAVADYAKAVDLDPNMSIPELVMAKRTKDIERDPNNAKAYRCRALAYFRQGDFDSAAADYTKAIELNPDDAEAYYGRGSAYAEKGDLDSARKDYTKALELNMPQYPSIKIILLTKAIELNPNDAEAYRRRGSIYHGRHDYDNAIADYTRALELDPDDWTSYGDRASVYRFRARKYRKEGDYIKFKDDLLNSIRDEKSSRAAFRVFWMKTLPES